MTLYRVSVFAYGSSERPLGLAVWDRFGDSFEDVTKSTLRAAGREWPEHSDFEVCVNRELPPTGKLGDVPVADVNAALALRAGVAAMRES